APAAEYGVAAIALQGGAHKDFKQTARAALGAAPKGRGAPRLLYVLAGIAVEEKDWTGALEFSKRLADEFPADEAADDVFESVGAGAVPVGAWPVVYEAYSELRRRYPPSPFAEAARLTLADAAYALGETYQGEGDFPAAAEYFMTAAYVAPESAAGRRALLGAAASLVAAKQPDSAAIVYKKLLDQPQVPADLAAAARKGLAGIGRR